MLYAFDEIIKRAKLACWQSAKTANMKNFIARSM